MARSFRKKLRNFTRDWLPARWVIRKLFLKRHGYTPNFNTPSSFSEKIQYRKLYEDQSRFPELADKVLVKNFVAEKIGDRFVIPTIWAGSTLPPRAERHWPVPFILKANHGSGMNVMVHTAEAADWDAIEHLCAKWMAKSWPVRNHEPWYNKIERQLLVEPLLQHKGEVPNDYKVFVFNGRATFIQADTGRFNEHRQSFYDRDWNIQPFTQGFLPHSEAVPAPSHLKKILEFSEILSEGFDFVRVDFYELEDGPRFGEFTFTPQNGFKRFEPPGTDLMLGNLWKITR